MTQSSFLRAQEEGAKYLAGNALVCSDNLYVLRALPDECVDLIYLDPPFQSATHYVAIFGDKGQVDQQLKDIWTWTQETENTFRRRIARGSRLLSTLEGIQLQAGSTSSMAAYCVYMGRRLLEMRRVLKKTGSIYLHCDHHASHYLRILMDAVFGSDNFRNEIVWGYPPGGKAPKYGFHRKHDTLLYYSRGPAPTFHHPYAELTDYQKGKFTKVDAQGRRYKEYRGKTRTYLDALPGSPVPSWWTDIHSLGQTISKERIGYPTQKPLALLERIIRASSNEGDLVVDPFCGCGTAVDAAAGLGRKYLGVDISAIAVRVMEQRLTSRGAAPAVYGLDWSDHDWEQFEKRALSRVDDAEDGVPGWAWAEDQVAGLLNAVPNRKKVGDGGVDARYYGAAGEVIPIQVKMYRKPVGRPDMDKLLGVQTAMQNQGVHAPMSLMVSLYAPARNLRTFAAQQGRVVLEDGEYPVMQIFSVEEMLTHGDLPKLPPVDPRSLVGATQTKMVLPQAAG